MKEDKFKEEKFWTPKVIDAVKNKNYYNVNGANNDGKIYQLDSSTVAKRGNERDIFKDYFWGTYAIKNEFQVPQICKKLNLEEQIKDLLEDNPESWFMVLKIIHGDTVSNIYSKTIESSKQEAKDAKKIFLEASSQQRYEIKKALDLGLYPIGMACPDNAIFSKQRGKLFHVDFEDWREARNIAELDKLYKLMKSDIPFQGLNYGK